MHMRLPSMILLIATLSAPNTQANDAQYVIRFPELGRVGQSYKVDIEAKKVDTQTLLEDEKVLNAKSEESVVNFKATARVLALNERRQETKRSYLIHRFIRKANGKEIELLPANEFIVAKHTSPNYSFTDKDGDPVNESARQVLQRIIRFDTSESPLDQIYGSETPRKVGDSWQGNAKALSAIGWQQGENVGNVHVKGTAMLASATPSDRGVLLNIEIRTEIGIPIEDIDESSTGIVEPVSFTVSIDSALRMLEKPDRTLRPRTAEITSQLLLRGKQGTAMEGKLVSQKSSEIRKYEYLPENDRPVSNP